MLVGAGMGAWLLLKAQRAAASVTPMGAAEMLERRLRHLGNDLAVALAEGRRTKQETEWELRQTVRTRPAIDAEVRTSGSQRLTLDGRAATSPERRPARR